MGFPKQYHRLIMDQGEDVIIGMPVNIAGNVNVVDNNNANNENNAENNRNNNRDNNNRDVNEIWKKYHVPTSVLLFACPIVCVIYLSCNISMCSDLWVMCVYLVNILRLGCFVLYLKKRMMTNVCYCNVLFSMTCMFFLTFLFPHVLPKPYAVFVVLDCMSTGALFYVKDKITFPYHW